jgi:hypothetical protein
MKNADDIVRYIENFYSLSLERPESSFGSPSQMEAVLWELEMLYEFIVDDEWESPGVSGFGYTSFLVERGYGVGRFTDVERRDPDEFVRMAAFWRDYLASDWRLGLRGEKRGNKRRKKGRRFSTEGRPIEEVVREVNEWMQAEEARKAKTEGKVGENEE